MKMLVAIANHGTKNRRYLDVLLAEYRRMRHEVHIVVLSDQPKDLGEDVEVRVGAPTSNPWSLPFAHRQLFADRLDDFDLFVYSEDDTLLLERQIDTFLELNALLPDDQVPGFQRYELAPDGTRRVSTIHSTYRWLPDSVDVHGGEVFADHTNLHAACYLLTQDQLRRAIASGGFLVPPHEGLFDMLVSAAVDPYTQCGLRRRLCVSRIEDVLLHHLPNVYVDKLGITWREYDAQIDALLKIAVGEQPRTQLLDPSSRLATEVWDVVQHPQPSPELLELAPRDARRVLSVGATSGAVERAVFPDAEVVAVPIDAVIGSVAATRGVRVLEPDLDALDADVEDGSQDVVFLHHVLHHVPHPATLLERVGRTLRPGGVVVTALPNVSYHALRRLTRRRHAPPIPRHGFVSDGVHAPGVGLLRRLERVGVVTWDRLELRRSDRLADLGAWIPAPALQVLGREVVAVGRPVVQPSER